MIKVGQTTTEQEKTLPFQIENDGDVEISLNTLKGNTTQNGTPTPTSPQQVNVVKGINLLYLPNGTKTNGGITATINDGVISYSGEATGTWADFTNQINGTFPAGTYTFSIENITPNNEKVVIYFYGGTTQNGIIAPRNKSITINVTEGHTSYKIGISGITAGTNYNNTIRVQLEQGSTATPYLPYNTIQAKVVGKNLIENIDIYNGYPVGAVGQTISYSSSANSITYKRCAYVTSGVQYILSWKPNTPKAIGSRDVRIINDNNVVVDGFSYSNANGNRIRTFTPIASGWVCAGLDTNATEVQIEVGSTATTYEAYKSNNYPITLGDIELCKIGTYQDRIYKNNGKWYLEKNIGKNTLVGTETFLPMKMKTCYGYYKSLSPQAKPNESATSLTGSFTNRFVEVTPEQNWVSASGVKNFAILNSAGQIRFSFGDTTNELEAFKTWLTTNNVIVYYILNTPTTTEITDETLLEQLDAIGELYRGTNNIMITDTIAPVENIIIEKSNAEFDLVPYIKREPKLDYIDRKGDTGYTADGHYFENIIARKRGIEFELIPMSQSNYTSVISHFIDKTQIPVYLDDVFTGQAELLQTYRKTKIPTKQITENGTIRGTTIQLEEI